MTLSFFIFISQLFNANLLLNVCACVCVECVSLDECGVMCVLSHERTNTKKYSLCLLLGKNKTSCLMSSLFFSLMSPIVRANSNFLHSTKKKKKLKERKKRQNKTKPTSLTLGSCIVCSWFMFGKMRVSTSRCCQMSSN